MNMESKRFVYSEGYLRGEGKKLYAVVDYRVGDVVNSKFKRDGLYYILKN